MNNVILMGRLTRDPDVRFVQGKDDKIAIARYTLAVNRDRKAKEGEQNADFIPCISFGKAAEFAEKYFKKGQQILIQGRIQTGSYQKEDGSKVYTTDVVIEKQQFADSKGSSTDRDARDATAVESYGSIREGFMNIPDGIDEELPFN